MSRNGPIGIAGMRPPARRPLPDDPFTAPPTAQPAPQWPPQYIEPQAQHAQQASYAQQPHHGQPPSYGQQPAYAPPQHAQPPGYAQAHAQQPSQGYYFPQTAAEPEPAPGYAPQAAAHQLPFESPAQAAPSYAPQAQPRWSQQPDPRGYDLGNYMPTAQQGYQPAEQAHFQPAPEPIPLQHHSEFDAGALPRQHDPGRFEGQHGYGENDADYDEMLAEDEEEPRRGRRGMMIAAALVGAIGLGGALAYTYKTFVASSGVRAPIIKAADFGPNKVKPVVQDGKSFPNTDKKLLNRLGEDGNASGRVAVGVPPPASAAEADDRASDDPNSPRKVRIIPITPGGPPAGAMPVTTASAPPRASNPPMVAVPGVTLENMASPQGPPSAARVVLPPQAQAPARAAPPPPVKQLAKAEPPSMMAAEPAPPVKKAAPVATQAVAKTPVPKTKTAAAAPEATATSGYVAVLSSKKSRMDALKAFADMQQKYGDALASKTPDVQEANLGEKGIWYRAVVGPPGSRDAAAGLCSKLKTAGYNGCWVAPY